MNGGKLTRILIAFVLLLVYLKAIWILAIPGAIVNALIYFSLIGCIFICAKGGLSKFLRSDYRSLILLIISNCFLLIVMYLGALITPPQGVTRIYSTIGFLQFIYPLSFFFVGFLLPIRFLFLTKNLIFNYSFCFVLFAFFEAFMPEGARIGLASFFLTEKTGFANVGSYYFRDFDIGLMRVGSLFFEPLTYSIVALVYFVIQLRDHAPKLRVCFAFFGVLISLVKSAVSSVVIIFGSMIFGPIFALGPILAVGYMSVNIYGSILEETLNDQLTSVGNHVSGLVLGLIGALDAPFWGHGAGTAGYLVYLQTRVDNVVGPFTEATQFYNGNESVIGVAAYQFGYMFLFLFVLLYAWIAFIFFRRKDRVMGGFTIAYMMFLFLSESGLSLVLGCISPLITVYYLRSGELRSGGKK